MCVIFCEHAHVCVCVFAVGYVRLCVHPASGVSERRTLHAQPGVVLCEHAHVCEFGGGGYVACVSSAALLAHAHTHAPAHSHPPRTPQQLHYQLEMARANLHENFARLQHQSLSGLFISQVIQENLEVYNM